MVNLGEHEPSAYNFDGAHRSTLDELIDTHGLQVFDEAKRHAIAYTAPHLACHHGAPSRTQTSPICSPNAEKPAAAGPPARPNCGLPETPSPASVNDHMVRQPFDRLDGSRQ
jgi:hypothetical protein